MKKCIVVFYIFRLMATPTMLCLWCPRCYRQVNQQAYLNTIGIKCCCLSVINAQTDTGVYFMYSVIILETLPPPPPPLGNLWTRS